MKYVKLMHATPMNPIETFEGEFIEEKVARVVENKEPIEDGAPIIYTERKDGVIPAYNIRTDKWDIALTAMDLLIVTGKLKIWKNQGHSQKMYQKKQTVEHLVKTNGKPESLHGENEYLSKGGGNLLYH